MWSSDSASGRVAEMNDFDNNNNDVGDNCGDDRKRRRSRMTVKLTERRFVWTISKEDLDRNRSSPSPSSSSSSSFDLTSPPFEIQDACDDAVVKNRGGGGGGRDMRPTTWRVKLHLAWEGEKLDALESMGRGRRLIHLLQLRSPGSRPAAAPVGLAEAWVFMMPLTSPSPLQQEGGGGSGCRRMDRRLTTTLEVTVGGAKRNVDFARDSSSPTVFYYGKEPEHLGIFSVDLEAPLDVVLDVEYFACAARRMSDDMTSLFKSERLTDFTVECGGRSLTTYRTLLAARSEVFRVMFEKRNDSFDKTDIMDLGDEVDPEAAEAFLRFLETDEVHEGSFRSHCEEIFALAHRYEVEELRAICRDFAASNLRPDNCLEALNFWCKYGEEGVVLVEKAFRILIQSMRSER